MKILLLGEFSSFHNNLKFGLEQLGHTVDIAALGDGFKNVSRDIDLDSSKSGFLAPLERRYNVYTKIPYISGYDVVQLINPFCLYYVPFLTKSLVQSLKKNNKKLFLSLCGTDSFYLNNAPKKMSYSPIPDLLKYDLKKTTHPYQGYFHSQFNQWLAEFVDGIIPVMYEYKICYKDDFDNKLYNPIPLPIDVTSIKFNPLKINDKLFAFHGLTRYGFKGTKHVVNGFSLVNKEHFETSIDGKMALNKYLEVMNKSQVIIDQTSSYSLGMNALYALAMGKIVLGGAEPESFEIYDTTDVPFFNILPSGENIAKQLSHLYQIKNELLELSFESRRFVEKHHNSITIAEKYLSVWNN